MLRIGTRRSLLFNKKSSGTGPDLTILPQAGPFASNAATPWAGLSDLTISTSTNVPASSRTSPLKYKTVTINASWLAQNSTNQFAIFLWCNSLVFGSSGQILSSGLQGPADNTGYDGFAGGDGASGGGGGGGGEESGGGGGGSGTNGGYGSDGNVGQGGPGGLGYGTLYNSGFSYGSGGSGGDGAVEAGEGGAGGLGGNGFGGGGGGQGAGLANFGGVGGGGGAGLICIVANSITSATSLVRLSSDGADGDVDDNGDQSGGGGGGGVVYIATRSSDGHFLASVNGGQSNNGVSGNPGTARLYQIVGASTLNAKTFGTSF